MNPTQPLNRLKEFGAPVDAPTVADGGLLLVEALFHDVCGCEGRRMLRVHAWAAFCPGVGVTRRWEATWSTYVQHTRRCREGASA